MCLLELLQSGTLLGDNSLQLFHLFKHSQLSTSSRHSPVRILSVKELMTDGSTNKRKPCRRAFHQ